MLKKRKNAATVDDRGLMEKVTAGDFRALDYGDAANALQGAAGLAGNMMPGIRGADFLNVAFAGSAGGAEASKSYQRILRDFGDPRLLARESTAFKKELDKINGQRQNSLFDAAASTIGGIAGGAMLGSFIGMPVPIIGVPAGVLIGSIGGGIAGSMVYNKACVKQGQDPLTINRQICKMFDDGDPIPPEMAFAAMAAYLDGKDGKYADNQLKLHTRKTNNTKFFTEALGDADNLPELRKMMDNPTIADAVSRQMNIPYDPLNPAAMYEQYAALINNGLLDPKRMLVRGEAMVAMAQISAPGAEMPQAPVTPQALRPGQERTV